MCWACRSRQSRLKPTSILLCQKFTINRFFHESITVRTIVALSSYIPRSRAGHCIYCVVVQSVLFHWFVFRVFIEVYNHWSHFGVACRCCWLEGQCSSFSECPVLMFEILYSSDNGSLDTKCGVCKRLLWQQKQWAALFCLRMGQVVSKVMLDCCMGCTLWSTHLIRTGKVRTHSLVGLQHPQLLERYLSFSKLVYPLYIFETSIDRQTSWITPPQVFLTLVYISAISGEKLST